MVPAQRRWRDGGSSSDVNGCQLELRPVCVPEEFLVEEIAVAEDSDEISSPCTLIRRRSRRPRI
jgi:hypothetical protein